MLPCFRFSQKEGKWIEVEVKKESVAVESLFDFNRLSNVTLETLYSLAALCLVIKVEGTSEDLGNVGIQ